MKLAAEKMLDTYVKASITDIGRYVSSRLEAVKTIEMTAGITMVKMRAHTKPMRACVVVNLLFFYPQRG